MYGPAVRCKWIYRAGGERSCINVSGLWLERCAPGHHGYQRASVLISRQASTGAIWVTSVRMRREDRTSISSHPLADLGWKLLIGLCHRLLLLSRSSFVRAKAVPSSRPAERRSHRAQGAVKAGRRAWPAAGSGVARLRLDRAE